MLDELDQTWEQSESQFDEDPLVGEWTETNPQAGLLRTNQEENWSQWLAHLLRDASASFIAEFLDPQLDTTLTHVRCERAFHDAELHDRRVDILVVFGREE